ncbi:hypothetical protein OG21DRAFT_1074593 [Imleria badia]|nr:hypothetical protein OG21DRAFT_1074593 [Imleria badia]
MLAVNFSFLAVPNVVTSGTAAGPIEIIIYCSVVSTVASIVLSFGLLSVYNNPGLLVAHIALEAMWTLSQTKSGMACLAITDSLPIASLIWSHVVFWFTRGTRQCYIAKHFEVFLLIRSVYTGASCLANSDPTSLVEMTSKCRPHTPHFALHLDDLLLQLCIPHACPFHSPTDNPLVIPRHRNGVQVHSRLFSHLLTVCNSPSSNPISRPTK